MVDPLPTPLLPGSDPTYLRQALEEEITATQDQIVRVQRSLRLPGVSVEDAMYDLKRLRTHLRTLEYGLKTLP